MSYLGTKELKAILPNCIDKFDESRIDNVAYELSLGNEVYLTDSSDGKKEILDVNNSQVVIKSGQFALLLTDEVVSIPDNILGFISIKFSQKIKGLINVSGFHVDPGFNGKIIFSVYNAGPASIILDKGKPYFMIWLTQLTSNSEPYKGKHNGQTGISAENISEIKGEIASPNVLSKRIDDNNSALDKRISVLEKDQKANNYIAVTAVSIAVAILVKFIFDWIVFSTGLNKGIELKSKEIAADSVINQKLIERKRLIEDIDSLEKAKFNLSEQKIQK